MSVNRFAPLAYVVDDDEAFRDSLRWLLEGAGCAVSAYSSAEGFLWGYTRGAAACLFLDVRLRGMSGLDLQRELTRRGDPLPIVFVSGHGDARLAAEAIRSGAHAYLHKPLDADEVLRLMQRLARTSGTGAGDGDGRRHKTHEGNAT